VGRPAPAIRLTDPQPVALRELAAEAARAAGALLRERFAAGPERSVRAKSTPTDLVSDADLAAEKIIRALLAERRPGDAVLGEEGGTSDGDGVLRWLVDPLDGTVNFLFGLPQWCVSVAVHDAAGAVAGAVYDPLRDELFAADRGGDATADGVVLGPPRDAALADLLVGTGFAYDAGVRARQGAVVAGLLPEVRDVRRLGASALDLAWAAAGRLDAYFERGVQPWDTAAGALVCACAGLEVRELPAADGLPSGILVAPPALIGALAALVG